jgi:hypothetical protein
MSSDFGNPLPYTHIKVSRISQPASSIATAILCCVLEPPKDKRGLPGKHIALRIPHVSFWKLTPWESHDLPMKPSS